MTSTEQVHAILESKGWRRFDEPADTKNYFKPDGKSTALEPNLLYSLDACHEVFEKDAPLSYWEHLNWVTLKSRAVHGSVAQITMRNGKATCAQRVEAMVRTIGKWKE